MLSDKPIIEGKNDKRIQLVRGCPCLREYGDERICINNDEINPIKTISLDPQFFVELPSVDDLKEFESTKEDLCYGFLNLDPRDGRAYCLSQGHPIRLNGNDIAAEHIRDALDFVMPSRMGNDDLVCSSCLYKYLVTLTDVFGNVVSNKEKVDVIDSYAQRLANHIATGLGYVVEDSNSHVDVTYDFRLAPHVSPSRRYDSLHEIRSEGVSDLKDLIDSYKNLQKLEVIFMYQVHSLNQDRNSGSSLTHLRLMIGTIKRILFMHDTIRNLSLTVTSSTLLSPEDEDILAKVDRERRRSEKEFRKFMPLLSKIEVRTE